MKPRGYRLRRYTPPVQMQRAIMLGHLADRIFRGCCRRRGLDPDQAMMAPIAAIVGSPMKGKKLSGEQDWC